MFVSTPVTARSAVGRIRASAMPATPWSIISSASPITRSTPATAFGVRREGLRGDEGQHDREERLAVREEHERLTAPDQRRRRLVAKRHG